MGQITIFSMGGRKIITGNNAEISYMTADYGHIYFEGEDIGIYRTGRGEQVLSDIFDAIERGDQTFRMPE